LKAFRESIWGLLLIVVVMGGIYSGIFTPTEAAAMSAVYAFIVAVFVYKDLGSRTCPRPAGQRQHERDAAVHHHQRGPVLLPADARERAAGDLERLLGNGVGVIGFLLAVNLLLLVMGNFMEPSSIILITGAHPVPDRDEAGHRPHPLRRHDHGEHGDRHDHAAGGPEPLRGQRDQQAGHERDDGGGMALAADHAGLPGHR
jgi:C4-dicarboxylate transporter DctM subunit